MVHERSLDRSLVDDIRRRIQNVNDRIDTAANLGRQFRIGHSFVTPAESLPSGATREWFRDVVTTEIAPLLEEYWFDDLKEAKQATAELLKDW